MTTAAVALFVNCMFFVCVLYDKKLHCVLNVLLASQAVVDVVTAADLIVFNVTYILPGEQRDACDVYQVLSVFVIFHTLILLFIITYDRTKLVTGALLYRHTMTMRWAVKMVAAVCFKGGVGERVNVFACACRAGFELCVCVNVCGRRRRGYY